MTTTSVGPDVSGLTARDVSLPGGALAVEMGHAPTGPEAPKPTENKPERPAWLPEKFATAEDMAKAYAELEKKQGQAPKPVEKPAEKPAEADGEKKDLKIEAEQPSQEDAEKALADRGLSMDEFSAEFAKDGKLSDESYEKLAKGGIPKDMVDAFIAGQEALASQTRATVVGSIGGEDNFAAMVGWASGNVPKAELVAYNDAVSSGDAAKAKLAVEGMYARYVAANGRVGKRIEGEPASGAVGYASRYEMTQAMRDPRYAKDPAYRDGVIRRLSVSNF